MTDSMTNELKARIIAGNLELHQQEAPVYDQMHGEIFNWVEQRAIRQDLALIRRLAPGFTALDVGCGTGNITLKLLRAGFQVTALDLSQPMLDILATKMGTGISSLQMVCQDIDTFLQSSFETYDVVTISAVLHHLPDYLATLSQLLARINPGGLVYVTHEPSGRPVRPMPGRGILYALDSQLSDWLTGRPRPIFDWSYSDYHIYHGFESGAVIECIHQAGFRIMRQRLYSMTMQLGISNLIDNLVYRTNQHFNVVCQFSEQDP